MELGKEHPMVFNFLQIRPVVESEQIEEFKWDNVDVSTALIYSESALGNGRIENIRDIIYVKPDAFDPGKSNDIAAEMETLNQQYGKLKRNYVLIGPGRWGSSDPWLGIPVKWPQISEARVIVEAGQKDFRVDPSQGTHFFQNLTSFGVGYLTINPFLGDGILDYACLEEMKSVYESKFIRCVRFGKPLSVVIDGKNSRGVVIKDGIFEKFAK